MMRKVKVVADKKRPYKMYAAIAFAFIGSLITNEVISSQPWAVALGGSLLAGIAVYIKSNPTVLEDDGLSDNE
jgi:hypothetical protein